MPSPDNEGNLARRPIAESDSENRQSTLGFFREFFKKYPNLYVYYPGCGVDFSLDDFLPPHKRLYLDKDVYRKDVQKGYFGNTPNLLDGEFDALYLRHAHQKRRDFEEMLRVVRSGGFVLINTFSCSTEPADVMTVDQIASHPQLKERALVRGAFPVRTFVKT